MALRTARKNRNYAVIRNNKLIIDGKEAALNTDIPSTSIPINKFSPTSTNLTQESIGHPFQSENRGVSNHHHTSTFRRKL